MVVYKVLKVLKNQKTLATNQKKLTTSYNVDHPDHPIKLASISGLDSAIEPEGEEAFNVPTPQFQEDPHSEDEDAAVGGDFDGEDDDEEEDESDEDDGEGDAGGDKEEAIDEDSESRDD